MVRQQRLVLSRGISEGTIRTTETDSNLFVPFMLHLQNAIRLHYIYKGHGAFVLHLQAHGTVTLHFNSTLYTCITFSWCMIYLRFIYMGHGSFVFTISKHMIHLHYISISLTLHFHSI